MYVELFRKGNAVNTGVPGPKVPIHRKLGFYCGQFLKMRETTIDHIVPEHLLHSPEKFKTFKDACPIDTLFPHFRINGYCNWVPSHGQSCNYRKGDTPFFPQVTIWYLTLVAKNLSKVEQELEKLKIARSVNRMLVQLETQIEKNQISEVEAIDSASKRLAEGEMIQIVHALAYARHMDEPLIVTFGLKIDDVLRTRDINDQIMGDIWCLYDWLERELIEHLASLSACQFYYTEESLRDGGSLSVRLVCPQVTLKGADQLNLEHFNLPCWEIRELTHFYAVYRVPYSKELDVDFARLQGYYRPARCPG
jgi:hypothetical protein